MMMRWIKVYKEWNSYQHDINEILKGLVIFYPICTNHSKNESRNPVDYEKMSSVYKNILKNTI